MPRTIGPGCMTIVWSWQRGHPAAVEAVAAAVLARGREERGVHPLALDPQHHHGVGLGEHRVEVVRRLARPGSTPTGSRVGGATSVTSAPRVRSSSALERATRLCSTSPTIVTRRPSRPPGLDSPRCCHMVKASSSAWVGCSWVPSPALTTLERDPAGVGEPVRGAAGAVPDDDGVGAHRLQGERGVLEALALAEAGALGGEVDDVGGEPLGRGLEGDAGAGGVLEEEVDDGAAAQGGQLLDRPVGERAISSAVSRTSSASSRVRSAALSRWRFTALRRRSLDRRRRRSPSILGRR